MKKTVPLVLLSLLVIGITGCDSSSDSATSSNSSSNSSTTSGASSSGTFTDSRDGQVYKYVKIGTQTWMAQNLNYQVDSSWCYDDSAANCSTYGRLYQWAAAMAIDTSYNRAFWKGADSAQHQGICPSGWHIPNDTEWGVLLAKVGADSARIKLSSTNGWDNSRNGTNADSFSVLPAGYRFDDGTFYNVGKYAYFWSSSEYDVSDTIGYSECGAWSRRFNKDYTNVIKYGTSKGESFSLRCLKDN